MTVWNIIAQASSNSWSELLTYVCSSDVSWRRPFTGAPEASTFVQNCIVSCVILTSYDKEKKRN